MARFRVMILCGLITGASIYLNAEETKPKEVKGLDVVPDTAVTVIKKTNAFFQGNLEFTMTGDAGRARNKNNYKYNKILEIVKDLKNNSSKHFSTDLILRQE